MTHVRLSAAIAMLLLAPLAARSIPAAQPSAADATAPDADHAVGFFDERLQRVVLIGGAGDPRADTRDRIWSWSGRAWELVADSGPIGRVNASAAYDRARGAAVIAGGSRRAPDEAGAWTVVGDTWAGNARDWQRLEDITPRDHHAMVSGADGTVILFGGIAAERSAAWPADTWNLRGTGWQRVATQGPLPRGRTALAYDAARRQVVLFGGVGAPSGAAQEQVFLNDTWIWEQGSWRQAEAAGPRGRYAHAMVFDERAAVTLLYSGSAAHRNAPLTDMWRWDGRRWTEIPLAGSTPGHRYQPVMVYDRARGRTVLFGGRAGARDTWEWDGQRWQDMSPATAR